MAIGPVEHSLSQEDMHPSEHRNQPQSHPSPEVTAPAKRKPTFQSPQTTSNNDVSSNLNASFVSNTSSSMSSIAVGHDETGANLMNVDEENTFTTASNNSPFLMKENSSSSSSSLLSQITTSGRAAADDEEVVMQNTRDDSGKKKPVSSTGSSLLGLSRLLRSGKEQESEAPAWLTLFSLAQPTANSPHQQNALLIEGEGLIALEIPDWPTVLKAAQEGLKSGLRRPDAPKPVISNSSTTLADQVVEGVAEAGCVASQTVEVAGFSWRIIAWPTGNHPTVARDELAIFVECLGPSSVAAEEDWHVCARLAISVVNMQNTDSLPRDLDETEPHLKSCPNGLCKVTEHRFDPVGEGPESRDWGFQHFVGHKQLSKDALLTKPTNDANEPSLVILAKVQVVKDVTGVLWHTFVNYSSKRVTGYVGLQNQGATCYMNSLLQALYCLPAFRKIVYSLPTVDDGDACDSIPLALQRLFYRLQTSQGSPVSTAELTRSFGWDTMDAFMQHDVQEFSRVLLDDLQERMKSLGMPDELSWLMAGKMRNVIRCLHVPFQSTRTEFFYDLQMACRGHTTLLDSFKAYCTPESMTGSNAYRADGYADLQEAERFVAFERFPPVLFCHLVRYEYDAETGDTRKYNGRLEYPTLLDLNPFVIKPAGDDAKDGSTKEQEDFTYQLHAVLVHSGDSHGGHYFVFIRDGRKGRWLRFDDTRVTPVSEEAAVQDNYGINPNEEGAKNTDDASPTTTQGSFLNRFSSLGSNPNPTVLKRFTNAYMLVYIQKRHEAKILEPLPLTAIPGHIPTRIQEEEHVEERKRHEKMLAMHSLSPLRVVTEEAVWNHHSFDLFPIEQRQQTVEASDQKEQDETAAIWEVKGARKDEPLEVLKKRILEALPPSSASHLSNNLRQVQLWTVATRKNRTVRLEQALPNSEDDDAGLTFNQLPKSLHGPAPATHPSSNVAGNGHFFFVGDAGVMGGRTAPAHILLWIKWLAKKDEEGSSRLLETICPVQVKVSSTLSNLIQTVKERVEHLLTARNPLYTRDDRLTRFLGMLSDPSKVQLWEELKPGKIDNLTSNANNLTNSLSSCDLRTGDIVVFAEEGVDVAGHYDALWSTVDCHVTSSPGISLHVKVSLKWPAAQVYSGIKDGLAKRHPGSHVSAVKAINPSFMYGMHSKYINIPVDSQTPLGDLFDNASFLQQPSSPARPRVLQVHVDLEDSKKGPNLTNSPFCVHRVSVQEASSALTVKFEEDKAEGHADPPQDLTSADWQVYALSNHRLALYDPAQKPQTNLRLLAVQRCSEGWEWLPVFTYFRYAENTHGHPFILKITRDVFLSEDWRGMLSKLIRESLKKQNTAIRRSEQQEEDKVTAINLFVKQQQIDLEDPALDLTTIGSLDGVAVGVDCLPFSSFSSEQQRSVSPESSSTTSHQTPSNSLADRSGTVRFGRKH